MIGILAGTLLGVAMGAVSGLIPGVHSNTMAGVLLGAQTLLLPLIGPEALAASLVSTLITHSFLDSIPSTFLGVPDPDTALSVLPAHALCLEGKGEEAVRIAAIGSASGVIIGIPVCIALMILMPSLQPFLDWGIGIILVAVSGYLLVTGESPGWALLIFLVSGLLGVFALNFGYLCWPVLGEGAVLMPLLSGLFGISVLILASPGPIPPQRYSGIRMTGSGMSRQMVLGTAAGAIVGWLPGLSNASAQAVLSPEAREGRDRRGYIIATSAAATANAVIGLAALYALSRTRNGVMAALSRFELPPFPALLGACALAACIAYPLTVTLSRSAPKMNGIDSRTLSFTVIGFVAIAGILATGPFGAMILILATLVGLTPQIVGIPRIYCMGAITIPVILFSFGF